MVTAFFFFITVGLFVAIAALTADSVTSARAFG
jgi:hypothetical protein